MQNRNFVKIVCVKAAPAWSQAAEGHDLCAVSKWKITDVVMGDAESDAFPEVNDRKLEALLQVWADLPESVKDALLVMVSDRSR